MNQIAPTQPTPLAPETRLAATLSAAVWNIIMAQLAEGPYRVVAPVIDDIRAQLALGVERVQRMRDNSTHATADIAPAGAELKREAS